MGAHDEGRVYRVGPSSVYINPDNNNDRDNDFGGTLLGLVDALRFSVGDVFIDFEAEEYGTVIARQRFQGPAILSLLLRQWDVDSIGTFFPATAAGSEPVLGADRGQGQFVTGVKVLVAPPKAFEAEYPALILYSADPMPDAQRDAHLGTSREFRMPAFFGSKPTSFDAPHYRISTLPNLTI